MVRNMSTYTFERKSDHYKSYCINALFFADMHLATKVYKHFSLVTRRYLSVDGSIPLK